MPVNRPPVIRDQDKIDFRLTEETEYRIPFTFIEALNEGTLADRPVHAFLDAGFKPIGPIDVHRGDIDAVIDHMIKDGESTVRMQGFVFDRHAIGRLVLALSKFVHKDQSVITRSGRAGDTFRITVDFSHVIPPVHLSL